MCHDDHNSHTLVLTFDSRGAEITLWNRFKDHLPPTLTETLITMALMPTHSQSADTDVGKEYFAELGCT